MYTSNLLYTEYLKTLLHGGKSQSFRGVGPLRERHAWSILSFKKNKGSGLNVDFVGETFKYESNEL